MKTCTEPGCPALVERGRCARHGRPAPVRPSTTAQGYGASWRRKRAAFLAAHRDCEGDGTGQHHPNCDGSATVADHDPVTRRVLVARGDPDPDGWHHLVARSAPCHGRKTALFDGGWGNRPKRRAGYEPPGRGVLPRPLRARGQGQGQGPRDRRTLMDDTKVADLIQEAMDFVTNLGDDTKNLTQEESLDFYRGVADDCTERANLIRSEMG